MLIGINFDGGFCITSNKAEMENVIKNSRHVIAGVYPSFGEAYKSLIDESVDRNIATDTIPVLPRYSDFCHSPYFMHPNMKPLNQTFGRTFVLWNKNCCGIYTDLEIAVNDFLYMALESDMILVEAENELDAVRFINYKYKKLIFPLLPEITKAISFLEGPVRANVLHEMPYTGMFKDLFLHPEIKALNPYLQIDNESPNQNSGKINAIEILKE